MEELLEKLDNLKKEIDNLDFVKELLELQDKISKDEVLSNKLKEYKEYPNNKLKEDIMNNPLFKKYKEKETDLNILILDMNNRLKEISKNGDCKL